MLVPGSLCLGGFCSGGLCPEGLCPTGESVCVVGWGGGSLVFTQRETPLHPVTPHVNRMPDASKNITLPQTSYVGGINTQIILFFLKLINGHTHFSGWIIELVSFL